MQALLDDATESWGIVVERVEIKDGTCFTSEFLFPITFLVRLPLQLQRSYVYFFNKFLGIFFRFGGETISILWKILEKSFGV